MLKNYLKIAFRNLLKNKLHASINILGLALGLAVAILIMLYVRHELSYDKWHSDADRIFRVLRHFDGNENGVVWTPSPLARTISEEFPEIEEAAGLVYFGETLLEHQKDKLYVENVALTDSTFFDVISMPFAYGNAKTALKSPKSIVVSQRIANIFFGDRDPVGETIRFNDEEDYTVTGVLAELPGNTHLSYEVYGRIYWDNDSWTGNNRATYILTQEDTDVPFLEEKLTERINYFLKQEYIANNRVPKASNFPAWELQPMKDIHLQAAKMGWSGTSEGNIKYVYIFILIAAIVLFIASINYMNLATARSAQRAREVGVRKVSGARKEQIVGQFLSEAIVQSLLALAIALALAELFLPFFNHIVDRELNFLTGNPLQLILPMLGLTVLVGLFSGSYPAFFLSAFQPVKVLKGTLSKKGSGQWFRRALVVTQFSMSVALIIVMAFIFKQVNFMIQQDLGFASDQVLVVPMNLDHSFRKAERLKSEFLNIPGVEAMATSSRVPGQSLPDWGVLIEGVHDDYDPYLIFAGEDFAKTIGLELVEGRFFSADHPADSTQSFVVNEAFVEKYNVKDPIGTRLNFTFEEEVGQIVGVVKDFHYRGLDRPIGPLLLSNRSNRWYTTFKISSNDFQKTISDVKAVWAKVEPSHPMRYSFLDEDFSRQYQEHRRFGSAMLYATILAIFIAILGLFGLASFTAMMRTKEIGIRKILGATINQISLMLIIDFVRWVLVAGVIALPIGYLVSKRWLEDFAFQTEISALPFVLSLAAALLIATLTVSFQAIKAALGNPVKALRYE